MLAKIKSRAKSAGFDLAKYEQSKHWTNAEWLRALSFRESKGYAFYLCAEDPWRHSSKSLKEIADSLINDPLSGGAPVLDDPPIADQTAMEFFDGLEAVHVDAGYREWFDALESNSYSDFSEVPKFLGVTSDRLFEIEHEVESIPAWRMHDEVERHWRITAMEGSPRSRPRFKTVPWKPFIKVNMMLSDKILIEEFQAWLCEARGRLDSECSVKKIRKPDTRIWYAKRYLPILDLKFWAIANGIDLIYEYLAQIVFPDFVDGNGEEGVDVDNVRKTLFKNALQLVERSTLRSLGYRFNQPA